MRSRARRVAWFGPLVLTPAALAQPSNGFGWVTVDHAGNRGASESEAPFGVGMGAVDHEYRISQTETTNAQWRTFLQAYLPFYQGDPRFDSALTGQWISVDRDGRTHMNPASANLACAVSWRNLARYCNWLHNGMVNEQWAFESGAYDTSTFTQNPDGSLNDAPTHLPGARYWIPSLDEWAKACWYDPNRYGAGREGFWTYPNGSDRLLISGLPSAGGETSAGPSMPDDLEGLPVGAYGARGPWGLCDMSGSVIEATELQIFDQRYRCMLGSSFGDSLWFVNDALAQSNQYEDVRQGLAGLRLCSPVPAPGSFLLGAGAAGLFLRRRRNPTRESLT